MTSKHLQNQRAGRRVSLSNLILMGATALVGGIAIGEAASFVMPKVQERIINFTKEIQQGSDIRREYREAGIKRLGHPARNYMEQAIVGDAVGIDGTENPEQELRELREYNSKPIEPLTDAQILHDNAIYSRIYGSD